ncbi:hypothetical protein SL103_06995 [Streptomyces lydicus]|uniref:NADP-dependent oxidoreductase domain-containing protein n=1 Tax=Streptomyces lydicus TaxID=47763 RepID=A0A1D7VH11_9ACTN|nr:hypothetical protein SL103_06995 [Streptomyces lydicus]
MSTEKIETVELGTGGPRVGAQGLGCMGMSFAYGPTDADEARATLERARELGVTLFDTADMYGRGENEKFLAPFVRAQELAQLEPIAGQVAGERYADMSSTSAGRE